MLSSLLPPSFRSPYRHIPCAREEAPAEFQVVKNEVSVEPRSIPRKDYLLCLSHSTHRVFILTAILFDLYIATTKVFFKSKFEFTNHMMIGFYTIYWGGVK